MSGPAGGALEARFGLRLGSLDLEVDLAVEPGRRAVLVGPNGAGKTTLLRALAGLQPVDTGVIRLAGDVLDDPAAGVFVRPERRAIGMVFQDGVLFPNLDAVGNVAFGLRARGVRRAAADARARELLARLGLDAMLHARPRELSGGQAQRVALARALAVEPRALLLDEPLAALDATTRVEVRRALREHLDAFPGVRLLVTHDPLDALTLADRLVVLEAGRVVQSGTPDDVRRRPGSPWVASLLGVNLLAGAVRTGGRFVLDTGGELQVATEVTGPAVAVVEPDAVTLFDAEPHGSVRNRWLATVSGLDHAPGRVRVHFGHPFAFVADVTAAAAAELALAPGARVWCAVKATAIDVHPR